MERIDLLIVGDALDGPAEEPIRIQSLDQAYRIFGGYRYERTTVTSGQTGYTLAAPAWGGECVPFREDSDGALVPQRLFEFSCSGSACTWHAMGETKPSVVFRTLTQPGPRSLLKGVLAAWPTGTRIHALRLGGSAASAGPSGGFRFLSRWGGSRYNGTTLTVTTGQLVVTPAPGAGKSQTFRYASDLELHFQLRDAVARGHQTFHLIGPHRRDTVSLPNGTYVLLGGTDGAMTPASFADFLLRTDLLGTDVLCPVGILTQDLSGAGTIASLQEQQYPVLLVVQAAPSGTALSGMVNNQRQVVSTAFSLTYDPGTARERQDDAAPQVAGLIAGRQFGITLAPLPDHPPTPTYDQKGIHAVTASGGHVAAYLSIGRGWALWHANTGDPAWPVSTFRSFQEVVRPCFETLEPLIGESALSLTRIEGELAAAFSRLTGGRVLDFQLDLQGDILYCNLFFQPYGEVRVIEAKVALGRSEFPLT